MRLSFLLSATAACWASASSLDDRATAPIVTLDYASYQGFTKFGVANYRGMSFAAAPTGDLRWKAPQDPPVTSAVQPATAFKDVCIGYNESVGYDITTDYTFSEDCLGISVQAPTTATNTSKLAVMFYLSGGGYGGLDSVNYNFAQFIRASSGKVVVVQANYRVAALGFLAGSEVQANGVLNAGLLDQRKALEWTKKYISHFGGDPNHVVMLGGSSGAGSIALQLSAYGGRNDSLFVGAVGDAIFSPTVNNATFSQYQFDQFASQTGCGSASDKLACLRALDINTLQKANVQQAYPGQSMLAQYIWTPVVDGTFVPDYPLRLYQNGKFVKVPLITGDVTNEGSLFAYDAASPADVSSFISANYPSFSPANLSTVNSLYPLMAPVPFHNAYFPSASAAYGEATFTCPGTLIARSMSSAGTASSVWNYHFNQPSILTTAAGLGVPHNIDLGAMFGANVSPYNGIASTLNNIVSFGSFGIAGENQAVVPLMMDYIISFVTSLNPNTLKASSAATWQPFDSAGVEQRVRIQDSGTTMETLPDNFKSRCQFWEDLIPVTGQ